MAGITRQDISNSVQVVARQSHDTCKEHGKAALKIVEKNNSTRDLGIIFETSKRLEWSVYADTFYASNSTTLYSILNTDSI